MKPCLIERLDRLAHEHLQGLSDVLVDCVEGGASIGFMLPFTRDRALGFWSRVADEVAGGKRVLLVARDQLGICGSVQLMLALPENQPHRADLVKMMVHRRARRQGLGAKLIRAAESLAWDAGKTLLVLDAVTDGAAARLYQRLGWVPVGEIPGFALMPDGAPCNTTVFYRNLRQPAADPQQDFRE